MRLPNVCLWLAASLVLTSGPAGARTGEVPSPTGQETAEYEKRLSEIKREIETLKGKISSEASKQKTILSSLDRIGLTKNLLRNELALLGVDLEKNRAELAAIEKTIPEIEDGLGRQREALGRILVTLYKQGRFSFLRFILEAPDLNALVVESRNFAALAASQEKIIGEFTRNLAELGRAEASLKGKERDISDLIQRAGAKKSELDAQEKRSRALVEEITSNIKTYEQAMEEKGVQARELQGLLQRFQKQVTTLPFPLIPFYEKKGKLPWPSEGKVLQNFGIQRHPRFQTVTMNNGIEVAAPKGDLTVRAVHAGRVVFADNFQGYGNLLIIDHGLTYYSLYGHCARFFVAVGDFVRAGQPIAEAGDTGSMMDAISVYFEIRYTTKPLDPLQWLARR